MPDAADADPLLRLHPDEIVAVEAVLDEGEAVRAVATPVRVRRPVVLTAALAFAAVSLVVSIGIVASGAGGATVLAAVLALLSLTAVGAADRWGRRTVAYAATDRRLLVVTDGGTSGARATAVPDAALSKRSLDVRSTGRGTIRLRGKTRAVDIGPIADVRAFDAHVDALPGASPAPLVAGGAAPATRLEGGGGGIRDADVARIAHALTPGERVIWMGQPEPTWGAKQTMNNIQKKSLPALIPIFVLIGAMVAFAAAFGERLGGVSGLIMPVFQFSILGYTLWMARQLRRRSLYVVTDRRALVGMPGLFSYDVTSHEGAALASAEAVRGLSGRCSIVFATGRGAAPTVPGYRGGRIKKTTLEEFAGGPTGPGFEFIRDADAVVDLLRRVGGGEAPAGDLLARRLPERAASGLTGDAAAKLETSRAIPLPSADAEPGASADGAPLRLRTRG